MSRYWPLASTMSGSTDGSNFTLGNAGHATIAGNVTQLWFYRANTASSGIPVNLKLWNGSTGALLASIDPASASAGTGWKSFDLPTPVFFDVNAVMVISAYWPAGRTFPRVTGSSRPTPESPLVWETNFARSNFGSDAYPATAGTGTCEGVDVTFTTTDVPNPGGQPINIEIENALNRWFSSSGDNTRQAQTPYQTWLETFRTGGGVDGLIEKLDADGWPVVLGGVNKANLPAWLTGAGTVITAAKDLSQIVKDWLGDPADPDAGTTNAKLDLIAEGQQPAIDWSSGRVLSPAYHTFDDSEDFTSVLVWTPGPGIFKLSLNTWGANQGSIALPNGNTWLPRAGWWAPVFADAEIGERKFVEFQTQWLWPMPQGASGVIVYCGPGTGGTVERFLQV